MDRELTQRATVLVAREESGVVTEAFRKRGAIAYSIDLLPTSGKHPEWHIQGDVLEWLNKGLVDFADVVIAFPPCTHLAASGARWWPEKRADGRQQEAIDFFMAMVEANAPFVAVENPVGIMSTVYRKPDQYVEPWWFGHGEQKKTGLWLKGLPLLKPTNPVDGREQRVWRMPPSPDRAKLRSKTPLGMAEAMADQWLPVILKWIDAGRPAKES